MATLRYLDDAGRVQTRKLDAGQIVIGRAPTCHVAFDSDMISREHARIELTTDGRFRVLDLGSRNKTFVNGEQITETLLTPGDIVRVGDLVLEFVDESSVAAIADTNFLTPDRSEPANAEWIKIKQPVSLSVSQLEQVAQLGSDQPLTARAENIASVALGRVILDLQAERGFVALRGEKKTELRPIAHRGLSKPLGGSLTPVSESFALAPILQQVSGSYPQTGRQIDNKLGYAVTAVVAPLTFRGDIVGVLYVDRPTGKRPFSASSIPYAVAAGAQIGSLLGEAAQKLSRSVARESAAWMSNIRRLQRALSVKPIASDTFQVACESFPGRARCGDFSRIIHVDDQRCAVIVIDGGGHGMTGLAQAGTIQGAVSTAIAVADDSLMDPAAMFNAINQIIAASPARQVLPTVYAAIDMSAGKLVYVNAGCMPPLLMVGPGRLLTLDQTSLVLGVDTDYLYEATRVDLPEAFRLVCYTDGLIEAASAGGDPLGSERLHEVLLNRDAFGSADDVLARIVKLWNSHLSGSRADDDATAVVVARGRAAS